MSRYAQIDSTPCAACGTLYLSTASITSIRDVTSHVVQLTTNIGRQTACEEHSQCKLVSLANSGNHQPKNMTQEVSALQCHTKSRMYMIWITFCDTIGSCLISSAVLHGTSADHYGRWLQPVSIALEF